MSHPARLGVVNLPSCILPDLGPFYLDEVHVCTALS